MTVYTKLPDEFINHMQMLLNTSIGSEI